MKEKSTLKENEITLSLIKEDELTSFNDHLYDEYTISELEERLETKPWMCGVNVDCPQLECGQHNPPPEDKVEEVTKAIE
ncbi:hypothetical protein HZQ19_15455 [Elizabethkingia anophelis]|uniref:hypothetical protein n=1 Tax=Elizabethkingia anophelis TaxID=1117645 RepID=UPI000C9A607C|nr:hypothetical protein [Elizabethkingia anophelis]MCT3760269.1 hypothetical protein [Elizabethkingia anophelis]MCT3974928.1 hypothetical protein [Elizabethkingia anophelis]MCT4003234.1 hypothetical protein [Elizabethkingia anophelis]MCT4017253.1 hypothetical protein [Elizabethkingia anophelis]MCT4020836.1 hypothetical protein [Elizabethkingia anophelis]